MAPIMGIIRTLVAQRAAAKAAVDRLDRAIAALSEVGRRGRGARPGLPGPGHMSAAARKRISDAQRARWARIKGATKPGVPAKPRRHISAAGRKRIADAQRARWARVRAAAAKVGGKRL
jgi:plasmid stabilization system protein ParE